MNVNAVPVRVQLLQLEPIRKFVGTTFAGAIVGPGHAVYAYWLPEASFT